MQFIKTRWAIEEVIYVVLNMLLTISETNSVPKLFHVMASQPYLDGIANGSQDVEENIGIFIEISFNHLYRVLRSISRTITGQVAKNGRNPIAR